MDFEVWKRYHSKQSLLTVLYCIWQILMPMFCAVLWYRNYFLGSGSDF